MALVKYFRKLMGGALWRIQSKKNGGKAAVLVLDWKNRANQHLFL